MFDGSDPKNKEKRNAFWEISGKRAIYPQVCSFVLGTATTGERRMRRARWDRTSG